MSFSKLTSQQIQKRIIELIKEHKLTQTGGLILLHYITNTEDLDEYLNELEEYLESNQFI